MNDPENPHIEEEEFWAIVPDRPNGQLEANQSGVLPAQFIEDTRQANIVVREGVRLRLSTELDFGNLFEYVDATTRYKVDNIRVEPVSDDEIKMRYKKMPFHIQRSTKIDFDIVDSSGKKVGHFIKRALFMGNEDIWLEHDDAEMDITGTGFGSRFQRAVEDKYRQVGIKAIVRGCGLSVGRYEGAKNDFDFLNDKQRQRFIKAFCAFLEEKGIQSVIFDGESFIINELEQKLRTPQDILAVKADNVDCAIMDREWDATRNKWIIKNKRTENFSPGKAFFLDQESNAKRNLDDEFYSGKWIGIKQLV